MPQPESESVRVLRDFRVRMDAEDTRLMMDMGNRWLAIERVTASNIAALSEEMVRRTLEGETVTTQMVYRAERYQVIQRQLETEVKKYNKDYAVGRIVDAQETAAALGVDAAQASIFASYPSPLSANFNRVNVAAVESLAGFAGDGTPLRRLLDKAVGDASEGIVSAMLAGLGSGQGAVAIAKSMADGMGLGLDRSILIARTETQRAYRSGTVQQYRESGVVSGFMRLVKKDGACIGCLALDGELFELADELDDHPNGRCTAVPIVRGMEPPEWEKGDAWLANQDEAKQREILGPARFEMYQNGTPLSAFATKTHNDVWGSAPQVVSIKDLTEGGAVVVRGAKEAAEQVQELTVPRFETNAEAAAWVKEQGFASDVDFGKLDIRTVQDMVDSAAKHVNDFPQLKDNLKFIGSAQSRNKLTKDIVRNKLLQEYSSSTLSAESINAAVERRMKYFVKKVPGNTYAISYSEAYSGLGGIDLRGIVVNEKYGKDWAAMSAALKKDVASKWHPVGADTMKSVMDHEFSHQIHTLLGQRSSNWERLITDPEIVAIRKAASQEGMDVALSRYAQTNSTEFMAESWAEYLNNPNPRPTAQAVGDRVLEIYKELYP